MPQSIPLSQQAYEQLRHKIVTLELPPGSVIDEGALQEELGVGRTPIREALKRLSLENLVTIVPRRGMFVTEIGINDLQRLLEVRLVLESLAVRLAAQRGTAEHWQQLQNLVANPSGNHESAVLIQEDEEFHKIIYDAADNHYLHDALVVLLRLNERLWYYFLVKTNGFQRTAEDHRAIAEKLQAGDGSGAEALMIDHITRMQKLLQKLIVGESG